MLIPLHPHGTSTQSRAEGTCPVTRPARFLKARPWTDPVLITRVPGIAEAHSPLLSNSANRNLLASNMHPDPVAVTLNPDCG